MLRLLRFRCIVRSGLTGVRLRSSRIREVPKVTIAASSDFEQHGEFNTSNSDDPWGESFARLNRLFEIRDINRQNELAYQSAREQHEESPPAPTPPPPPAPTPTPLPPPSEPTAPDAEEDNTKLRRALDCSNDFMEVCNLFAATCTAKLDKHVRDSRLLMCNEKFSSMIADAPVEVILSAVSRIPSILLAPFADELHLHKRLPSFDPKSRARLLQVLGVRLLDRDVRSLQHANTALDEFSKYLLNTASEYSRREFMAAVFGMASVQQMDSSALVTVVFDLVTPSQVAGLSHQEYDWLCYITYRYPLLAKPALIKALSAHFADCIHDFPPHILAHAAYCVLKLQDGPFDARTLAKLDMGLAPGFDSLSHISKANVAQIFSNHARYGFTPTKIDFGRVLTEQISCLKDWQIVLFARCLILSSRMTSPIMRTIISDLRASDRNHFESIETITYLLTALLHRGFQLPEVTELGKILAERVNPRHRIISCRDSIFLLRNLLLLDAVKRKDAMLLFDYSVSSMRLWRTIDVCTLLEALHVMRSNGWRSHYRKGSEFLVTHQNHYRPVLKPNTTTTAMIACNYLVRMRWTNCKWLDVFSSYIAQNFEYAMDFRRSAASPEMVSHFFENMAETGAKAADLFLPLSALIVRNGIGYYFPKEHQQVRVIWACVLQDAVPPQALQQLFDHCTYSESLKENNCIQQCSQLVAFGNSFNASPTPPALLAQLERRPPHRSLTKFIGTLGELAGPECVLANGVTQEGLLVPVSLVLDAMGRCVPWEGKTASPISASSLKEDGLEPIALIPLEERDHTLDMKSVMPRVEFQGQLLEKAGWRVVTVSLPAIRVAVASVSVEEAKSPEATQERLRVALRERLEQENVYVCT